MAKNFLIRIIDTQHSTWQGSVTWVDKNETQSFRSSLELIKMIDSALAADIKTRDSADKSVQSAQYEI